MESQEKGSLGEFIEDSGSLQNQTVPVNAHGGHVEGNIRLLDAEGQIRLVPTPRSVYVLSESIARPSG